MSKITREQAMRDMARINMKTFGADELPPAVVRVLSWAAQAIAQPATVLTAGDAKIIKRAADWIDIDDPGGGDALRSLLARSGTCPACAEKDAEIGRLREIAQRASLSSDREDHSKALLAILGGEGA